MKGIEGVMIKKTRSIISTIIIMGLLTGCSPAALGLFVSAMGWTTAALDVASIVEEIKKSDLQKAVAADFETTEAAVKSSFEALDIEIKKVKRNEKGDGGEIIGLTAYHRKIRILMAQATSQTTEMGIWVQKRNYDRDPEFANLIAQEIDKQLSAKVARPIEIEYVYIIVKGGYQVKVKPDPKARYFGTTAPEGKFKKIGSQGDWIQVEGTREETGEVVVGWIPKEAVKETFIEKQVQEKIEDKTVFEKESVQLVTVKTSNIRQGPSTKTAVIKVVQAGTELKNIGERGNWIQVQLESGEVGWIYKTLVEPK